VNLCFFLNNIRQGITDSRRTRRDVITDIYYLNIKPILQDRQGITDAYDEVQGIRITDV